MAFLTLEDRYAEIEVIVFPKQLEAFGSVLLTDTAVRIKGTLADREDEGVKILLSEAQLLSTNADLQAPKTKSTDASFPPASSARLYLRVPSLDDPLTKEALEILNFAKGEVTVLLYDQKTGKTVSPKNTRTTASELLLGALRALLGEANVVYRP